MMLLYYKSKEPNILQNGSTQATYSLQKTTQGYRAQGCRRQCILKMQAQTSDVLHSSLSSSELSLCKLSVFIDILMLFLWKCFCSLWFCIWLILFWSLCLIPSLLQTLFVASPQIPSPTPLWILICFVGVCVFFYCSFFLLAFFMLQILAYFQILAKLYTCLILSGYHILLWYACVPSIFEGSLLTFCVLNIAVRLKWRLVLSIKVLLLGF